MYLLPGLLPLGFATGLVPFMNATIPFVQQSTNITAPRDHSGAYLSNPADEIPLPVSSQAYGYNTLLINTSAAATLDMLDSAKIKLIQQTMVGGESWDVTATVLATTATRNDSLDAHRNEDIDSPFWSSFDFSINVPPSVPIPTPGGPLFISDPVRPIGLLQNFRDPRNAPAWMLLSIQNDTSLSGFIAAAKLWMLARQYCFAHWTITRGDVLLKSADCDPGRTIVPEYLTGQEPGLILTNAGGRNELDGIIDGAYREYLAVLMYNPGNYSIWESPTMAVCVASAYWSRIAAWAGPDSPHWAGPLNSDYSLLPKGASDSNSGLHYNTTSTMRLTRPAMKRSGFLFAGLALQPFIMLVSIALGVLWKRVPISHNFGMTAILAGVDKETLGLLRGAAYSGDLKEQVHLAIEPDQDETLKRSVVYHLTTERPVIRKRLSGKLRYS